MKAYHLTIKIILPLLILMIVQTELYSQSVRRESINSYGASGRIEGVSIMQTAGQTYATIPYLNSPIFVNPGFQQPVVGKILQEEVPALLSGLYVYPNPAKDFINLSSNDPIKQATIKVFDMNGHIIYNQPVSTSDNPVIKCETWPAGIYAITLQNTSDQQLKTARVIITR